MKSKPTKAQRIETLERQLREAIAGQAHVYGFNQDKVAKASTKHMMASGVIITITALGGREVIDPVLIRDGLSEATVKALQDDMMRSYELATTYRPTGLKEEPK